MMVEQHLILQELTWQPSAEELPVFHGWLVARVVEGLGYWLQHDVPASQLAAGDGFIATSGTEGRLRASQLDPLKLQFFTVHPQHLDGVLTVAEWRQIEVVLGTVAAPVLFFKSADSIGQKFARLASLAHSERLPLRCALLQLWAAAATDLLALEDFAADNGNKLRNRFWRLFGQMTKVELCLSSPTELARQINCSERHFRGLFRKEFGIPLHAYQAELWRQHAGQLPGDANGKNGHNPCRSSRRPGRFFPVPDLKNVLRHLPDDDRRETSRGNAGRNGNRNGNLKTSKTKPA